MSSCSSRARLVRTTMSRSVRDWKVPPLPQVEHALEHLARLAPHDLEPVVGTVEELLLILQIGMFGHRSPFSPCRWGNDSV